MTSIPLILHYQPTLHLLTNLIQFYPILTGPYILAQNLNPPGHYILGRREYMEYIAWQNIITHDNFLQPALLGLPDLRRQSRERHGCTFQS
jgi:hypothetical protein